MAGHFSTDKPPNEARRALDERLLREEMGEVGYRRMVRSWSDGSLVRFDWRAVVVFAVAAITILWLAR